MKKNVLVLTGSPRRNGNSEMLADAFIKGAMSADREVVKFETAMKEIKGCKACNQCYSKGAACIFNDDFNELAPLLEKADVLVLATPLYWFSFPMQIKAALDKMYALGVGERPMKIKECYLLACAEDEDESCFEGLVKSYEHIAQYKDWKDAGQLLVTAVNDVGDIKNTQALQQAERLGASV